MDRMVLATKNQLQGSEICNLMDSVTEVMAQGIVKLQRA